jgi:hypothetical protein
MLSQESQDWFDGEECRPSGEEGGGLRETDGGHNARGNEGKGRNIVIYSMEEQERGTDKEKMEAGLTECEKVYVYSNWSTSWKKIFQVLPEDRGEKQRQETGPCWHEVRISEGGTAGRGKGTAEYKIQACQH